MFDAEWLAKQKNNALRDLLKDLQLSSRGNKPDLIARLSSVPENDAAASNSKNKKGIPTPSQDYSSGAASSSSAKPKSTAKKGRRGSVIDISNSTAKKSAAGKTMGRGRRGSDDSTPSS